MSYIYNRQSIPGHLLSLPGKGQACHFDINLAIGITISSLLRNKIFTLSTYLLHCSTIPVCEVLHPVIWIIWQYFSYRWVIPSDVVPTYFMNIYSCKKTTTRRCSLPGVFRSWCLRCGLQHLGIGNRSMCRTNKTQNVFLGRGLDKWSLRVCRYHL